MADFQYPDLLGSYIRGNMLPGQQVQQNQAIQGGQLNLLQMGQGIQKQGLITQYAQQLAQGDPMQGGGAGNASPGMNAGGMGLSNYIHTGMALDVLEGRNPIQTMMQGMQAQKEQLKMQLSGPLSLAERFRTDPMANIAANKNPAILQQYKQWAAQHGINPDDPTQMTVENVQRAAGDMANQIRAQYGEEPKDYNFTGTLSPGQVHMTDGRVDASAPDTMTAFQRIEAGNAAARLNLDRKKFDFEQQQSKIPTGYEADPDHPGMLRYKEGGPADPNAPGKLDARSGVMFQRVASSANNAVETIKNIAELPMGASTGLLGIGAHQGTGLFSTGISALKQSVSSQNVQDYNVMITGLQRNLATIETAGLAPPGSLTDAMKGVVITSGDSGLTILRRSAEVRQIIQKNLEPTLANPRLPEAQKQMVRDTIDQVKQAVPFTHHDITQLEQSKNPKATIMDYAKSQGLGDHPPEIQSLLDKYK